MKVESGIGRWCSGVDKVVVSCALAKHEGGGGGWAKTRNRAVMTRFNARRVEQRRGMVLGGGVVARTRWWWWWGRVVAKHEEGRGVWVKIPKPSPCGSVSGAPCGTGMGDGAWGWHVGTYQAAAAVGLCGRETRGGQGDLGENPETEPPWLSFGRAVWKGNGRWCLGVGRWHVPGGGGGGGVVRSRNTRRGGGFG